MRTVLRLDGLGSEYAWEGSRALDLQLVTPNRSYWFVADNHSEMEGWMNALRNQTIALLNNVMEDVKGKAGDENDEITFQGALLKQGKKVEFNPIES